MDKNIFQRFPEIGYQILSDLDLPTLMNCRLVCISWYNFLENPYFWLKKLKEEGQPSETELAWKNLITKSIEFGFEEQIFAKCLRMKFQQYVERKSYNQRFQDKVIFWLKCPPLHTASLYGQIEVVKLIYQFQLDFNRPLFSGIRQRYLQTEYFEVPIFAAIANNHTEVAKFLANTSTELQNPSVNFHGLPPIYMAIQQKNLDLVKFLVPRTQNLNQIYGNAYQTSLIHASIKSDCKILKYLISIPGVNPNVLDRNGETALQLLCRKNFISRLKIPYEDILEMIRILAPLADNNHFVGLVEPPLHCAVEGGSIEILKILVNFLDVNVKDYDGHLPVDVAVCYNNIDAIKILAPITKELRTLSMFKYFCKDDPRPLDLLKSFIEERNKMSAISR